MAEHTEAAWLRRLADRGRGKRRQEKEQDQHPAPHLHHGQDPQRFLQQAERQVRTASQQLHLQQDHRSLEVNLLRVMFF